MFKNLEAMMSNLDLLVFSDFNYGCLPQQLVENLIKKAKSSKIYLAADSQSSSQVGDIGRFKGVNLITPTEHEARISTRNREDGLVVLAEQLRQDSNVENVLLKMGEEGLLVHARGVKTEDWVTDRIEALNTMPKDVAGAGDSLLISAAMVLASGGSIWEAACIGSLAAGIQVGQVGNTPIPIDQIYEAMNI
jgi:bifunctional ADP-heptose synthase (sugar kinase/adenylyltransferase)